MHTRGIGQMLRAHAYMFRHNLVKQQKLRRIKLQWGTSANNFGICYKLPLEF